MRHVLLFSLLGGCSATATTTANTDCEVHFAPDVHTVLAASWTSPQPGRSWVEYDLDGEVQATPVIDDGGTAHRASLLGVAPLTDVAWTLITEDGDRRWSCAGVSSTENLEPQIIGLDVSLYESDLVDAAGYLLGAAYSLAPRPSVFITDRETGATRWYAEGDPGAQITSAALRLDGGAPALANGVIFNQADQARVADIGAVIDVSSAGERTDDRATPFAHHVFTQLPDGTTAWLGLEARVWVDPQSGQDRPVAGDSIHELAPDGTDVRIFSVFDWEPIARSVLWEQSLYPGYLDWTHANGLAWDEGAQAYVITFAGLEQVWLVGRDGVPRQRLGVNTDYPPAEGGGWASPHDGSLLPDGSLLVYLGSTATRDVGCHEFRVDEATHTLVETWRHTTQNGGFTLGTCQRLPNGNTLIGYGNAAVIQEVTPDGRLAWDAETSQRAGFGAVHAFADLYPPGE